MAKLRYTGIGLGCMILLLFLGMKSVSLYELHPCLLKFQCFSSYKTKDSSISKISVRRNLPSIGSDLDSLYFDDFSHYETAEVKTYSPASISSLQSWIRSNPSRSLSGLEDSAFSYIKESEYLASQFDFFLKVVCNQEVRFLLIKNFSKPFRFGGSAREKRNDLSFAEGVLSLMADPEEREYKPIPVKNVKTYSIFLNQFSGFEPIPPQPERALINLKFHRYLTLLLNFPPDLIEGISTC